MEWNKSIIKRQKILRDGFLLDNISKLGKMDIIVMYFLAFRAYKEE
jgi:hypothetical protein